MALALVYNAATPIFEASDEFRHFLTVRFIAQHHQLPVIAPEADRFTPGQEAGQPPLYYLAGAVLSGWVNSDDILQIDFNPHGAAGVPTTSPDTKNLFVHTPAEDFPYHGMSLAAHIVRLLSIVLGAVTVWLTYRLAVLLAPGRAALPALAAALVAFNPQLLFVSASVDNDALITTTATAALLVMANLLTARPVILSAAKDLGGSPEGQILRRKLLRMTWALSAILGAAALSKLSGLALIPLAAIVALYVYKHQAIKAWLILAAGPVAIAGWWAVRNWQLYGEPTGLSAWVAQYQGSRAPGAAELLAELPGLFMSYWGVFGAFDIKADAWVYVIYLVLMLAGLGGLFLARRRIKSWAVPALLAGWFLIELAALVRWTTLTTASTGRLLFPAIAALAGLVALGLLAPLPPKAHWPAALGLGGLLLGLAVFLPFRYIFPAYARPDIEPSAASLGQPPTAASITYNGQLQLIGYDLSPAQAKPGDTVTVQLYWRTLAPMDRDYSVTIQLLSGEGTVGQYDTFPGQGRIATRHLQPGDYFKDSYQVQVAPEAPAPLIARVKVGLYDFYANLAKLPATDASGAELAEPVIGELPIQPSTPAPTAAPVAVFGGQIALLAQHVDATTVAPGGALNVGLTWRAEQRMSQPYTIFLHLADSSGRPIAQHDAQPREGAFPTIWWAPGEVVQDHVALPIPRGAPPGAYQLLVGAYSQPSLQRLPVSTGGDAYLLANVTVSAG